MFEEIKKIINYWTKDNIEIKEITPETEFLRVGGCYQIRDIIDDIQDTFGVVFTVADIVSCLEKKLEECNVEVD